MFWDIFSFENNLGCLFFVRVVYHFLYFDDLNNIWYRTEIIKVPIKLFSLFFYNLLPLRFKLSRQHPILCTSNLRSFLMAEDEALLG
jgi:hypothetical protein